MYGDRGNLIALKYRAKLRGIDLEIQEVDIGETVSLNGFDICFIGGGQDQEQELVAADLQKRKEEIHGSINNQRVYLTVCGGYQLLGSYYQNETGTEIPGIEVLPIYTRALSANLRKASKNPQAPSRLIGNVLAQLNFSLSEENPHKNLTTLVGFENHSGRTYFADDSLQALARVTSGFGNNAEDGCEGAIYKNVFGTYLHGSLLPKNPQLTDELLIRAIKNKIQENSDWQKVLNAFVTEQNDEIELAAHRKASSLK